MTLSTTEQQNAAGGEEKTTKPIVGIIYPPPEHRNIIDKTALFVSRNGPEFEDKVRQNEISNSKFNFFNSTDPYYAYYQHKIKEFKEGKPFEPTTRVSAPSSAVLATQEKIRKEAAPEIVIPKEPPPSYEFMADPPSISGLDLDVVKLTAQFVARNGRHFLTQLMNKEQRNPQFDFLRPQHGLFQYFTKLVEQYTKVLIPPKDLADQLQRQSLSESPVIEEVRKRVEWKRHIERQKQKAADEAERERVAYGQIDWHDFVIVETVDFQPHETLGLPAPVTPQTVGARVLHQQRVETKKAEGVPSEPPEAEKAKEKQATPAAEEDTAEVDMVIDDMEESDEEAAAEVDSDDESKKSGPPLPAQPSVQPPPLPPGDLIIRKGYDPKLDKEMKQTSSAPTEKYVVNSLTGEKVPIDKMNEHIKYSLMDPRYLEEKQRQVMEKAQQEEIIAAGSQIGSSLKQLAERRTDIFGQGDAETIIGFKLGEEEGPKRDERSIWDGHATSAESTTKRAQANITIQDQIEAIHRAKGLTEDSSKERIGPQLDVEEPAVPPSLDDSLPPGVTSETSTSAASSSASASLASISNINQGLNVQSVLNPVGATVGAGPMLLPVRPAVPLFNPAMLIARPALGQNLELAAALAAQQRVAAVAKANAEMNKQAQEAAAARAGEEPPNKRQKSEADLLPENDFIAKVGTETVTLKVVVPVDYSKPEWNLKGQTIQVTLPYRDNVAVIKEKVSEQTNLPTGKQKLMYDGMFIKDSNSVAFYNMPAESTVTLQLKERGGRKK